MKRILSSFNLSGLFRKRQKLDDNRDADKEVHGGGIVQVASPERVPVCELEQAGAEDESACGVGEASVGRFSRRMRGREGFDADGDMVGGGHGGGNMRAVTPERVPVCEVTPAAEEDLRGGGTGEASLGRFSRRIRGRERFDADEDTHEGEHRAGNVQAARYELRSQKKATFPVIASLRPRVTFPTRKRKNAVRDVTPRLSRTVNMVGRFLLPRDVLRRIEVLNGYHFNDVSLLEEAFYIGSKVVVIGGRVVMESNLRLAMVGDRALALVWWDHWYDRHESRGAGQQRYQLASDNRELAAIGWHHCLDDFVINEKGFVGRKLSTKRMADTVEAFIGAVFLDSGRDLDVVKEVMISLMGRKRVNSV